MEFEDGRAAVVRVAYRTRDGDEVLDGELLDISRGGGKLTLPSSLPFGETIDLHAVIPAVDLEFTVRAVVSWNRQDEDDRWLIGCRFDAELSDAIVDRLAQGGYLERRHSPRYPISLEATASFELSEHGFSVWIQDFSTDGFAMLSPRPGKVNQRLRLETVKEHSERIVISARMRWCLPVDNGFLIGCAFLNGHDFRHLWEITYKTHGNQPLLPRVSLPPSRWSLAWFTALMACMMAYPVVIRFVSAPRSRPPAQLADTGVDQRQPAARPGDVLPPADQPSAVAGTAPVQPTRANSPPLPLRSAKLDRRANQLQQQAQELAERTTAFRRHRARWAKERQEQQARLTAEQQRIETARLVVQTERQANEAQRKAWEKTRRAWLATKKAWESKRQAITRGRQVLDQQRRQFTAEKEAWQRHRVALLAVSDGRQPLPPAGIAIGDRPAKPVETTQIGGPAPSTKPGQGETDRDRESITPRRPAEAALPSETDRRRGQAAFHHGRALLIERHYEQAARSLATAIEFDAGRPFYYYLLALAQYQLNDAARATRNVAIAVRLEQTRPIQGWGHRMERFQGAMRLWLEQARTRAKRTSLNKMATG